ncbi:carbohydrate kinase family protein [Micromonospora sp. NPDC049559]|uniref:carbohydrate kinase family protein n=1 Tax=Micromonospora sp. NPDC049559 TaxID=3155923 RepID=UPI00341F5F77
MRNENRVVVVGGCLAYDTVFRVDGRFGGRARGEDQSPEMGFLVTERRSHLGGCAGNISYGLRQFGITPAPLAVVGGDFAPYRRHLDALLVDVSRIAVVPEEPTSSCTILTDVDGAQITAHHLGAATHSSMYGIGPHHNVSYGVVAPTNGPAMKRHAKEFSAAGIPLLFQPGQVVETLSAADLLEIIAVAEALVVNEHEAAVIVDRTGTDLDRLSDLVGLLALTRGAAGSTIMVGADRTEVPAYLSGEAVDPTGCGDAYVAGLLGGMLSGLDPVTAGRVAALTAGLNGRREGTQTYRTTPAELESLFASTYGYPVTLRTGPAR